MKTIPLWKQHEDTRGLTIFFANEAWRRMLSARQNLHNASCVKGEIIWAVAYINAIPLLWSVRVSPQLKQMPACHLYKSAIARCSQRKENCKGTADCNGLPSMGGGGGGGE